MNDKFRILTKGEIIQKGDSCAPENSGLRFIPVISSIGKLAGDLPNFEIHRPVPKKDLTDYRPLTSDEIIQEGDSYTHKNTKYQREIKVLAVNNAFCPVEGVVSFKIDVYDVLQAFNVTNPALQHLIKKALCVGIRGHKDASEDHQDIIDSAERAKEICSGEKL